MAEETKVIVDPYVERILKARGETAESMIKILTPDPEPDPNAAPVAAMPNIITAVGEFPAPPKVEKTEAEIAEDEKKKAEAEAAEVERKRLEEEAAKKAAETPEQKAEREKKEAEAAKTSTADPVRPIVVQKKAAPAPDKKDEGDAAAKKAREEEESYIATLSDDQKDELALAEYAEKNGKTGMRSKVLDYCRKLDKFIADNPEAEPDSDEFIKFKAENEPKLTPRERRVFEREMIADQAAARAAEEARKEYEPVVRELNKIKNEPALKAVTVDVSTALSKDADAIGADVVTKIQSLPFQQAMDEFPIEAPIVVSTIAKAKELTRIWNGEVEVNLSNPDHAWLMKFIESKELEMQTGPAANQIRDGKKFVPLGKFIELEQTNPALARQCWTFEHKDLVAKLSENSVRYYQQQVKKLEASGFVRKPKENKSAGSEAGVTAATTTTTTTGSPKAGSHTMGGPGAEAAKPNPEDIPAHMRGIMKHMS